MGVVTISRQIGSFGDVIAAIVARRLGMQLMGQNQIHELAENCDSEYKDACVAFETEHGPGFFERIFFDKPSYKSLFGALIYEAAAKQNVVIVGRGAQIILRDLPGVFRARIVAPAAVRVERLMERYNISLEEAEEFAGKFDRERRNLITAIFEADPRDWSLYDVVLNTARYTADSASDVIIEGVKRMQKPSETVDLTARLNNLAMAKRIETLIRKRVTSVVAMNVEVTVESGGAAKISGRIADKRANEKIQQLVAQYPGITSVQNDLKVTEITF
jgi:cytidylate kinase